MFSTAGQRGRAHFSLSRGAVRAFLTAAVPAQSKVGEAGIDGDARSRLGSIKISAKKSAWPEVYFVVYGF